MKEHRFFNKKRMIREEPDDMLISRLITSIDYAGSPYHKRNPGDFGLTPPSQPRPDKSLCDEANIFSAGIAKELLIEGVKKELSANKSEMDIPRIYGQ